METLKELVRHYGAWLVIVTPSLLIWFVWNVVTATIADNKLPQTLGNKSFDVEPTSTGSFFLNLYKDGERIEHLEFFRPKRIVVAYGHEWLNDEQS